VGFATVITWFATVLLGLFMLTVWLIENDVTGQGVAPSRLPVPVIFAHLGLAATGLTVWTAFLIFNQKTLAWAAVGILGAIALLGATMFARWIPVYPGACPAAGPGAAAQWCARRPGGGQLPGRGGRSSWAARGLNTGPGPSYCSGHKRALDAAPEIRDEQDLGCDSR